MKLSREEEVYLRHWMFDEVHYAEGPGAAKRLQVERGVVPADLAVIIAASFPDLSEQRAAGEVPPSGVRVTWPWTDETFQRRLCEAYALLKSRQQTEAGAG
jgi:hypothetical protein